jgi:hypothetical protein
MAGKPTFEFGLVMAGAISAGAYTAGVVDFLIEALDAWEGARRQDGYRGPQHRALLKVMSGASAGGMTSAIAGVALQSVVQPVRNVDAPPPAEYNRLYDAWVRRIDVSYLLQTGDLVPGMPVRSLLDCTELERISQDALVTSPLPVGRAYVADPLPVYLTIANLRGVPYGFELFGEGAKPYGMFAHADHVAFAISRAGVSLPAALPLDPNDMAAEGWRKLAQAALATGAFPIGLRSRVLARRFTDFDGRFTKNPRWPQPVPPDPFDILCVDGGLMNNEPLELARKALTNDAHAAEGTVASEGVIMIDPFPNTASFDPNWVPRDGLLPVAGQMFSALINQARFKAEELDLASSPDVYNRYLIAPSRRSTNDGSTLEPAMASAILGGFGGFLSESFRRHDFQLGRRNCQAFLRRHFCLPESNALFGTWHSAEEREEWYVREGAAGALMKFKDDDPQRMLPIIPLMPSVAGEILPYPAPRGDAVDVEALGERLDNRLKAVAANLIDTDLAPALGGSVVRWFVRQGFNWQVRGKLRTMMKDKVAKELRQLK